MANTAYLNAMMRKPYVYWTNRGFEDGLNGRKKFVVTGNNAEKKNRYYNAGYANGAAYKKSLDESFAKGELG